MGCGHKMWWRDTGGELSGYQPLGCLLGQGFAPKPVALLSCKASAVNSAKTLLCSNSVPNLGPRGGKGEAQRAWGGLRGGALLSPLHPVSLQR